MSVHSALIERLGRTIGGDRRLDAEVTAYAVGPAGCMIDAIEGLDGWDILCSADGAREETCWREAADIPSVTLNVDAAVELLAEARPLDGAAIFLRALSKAAAAPCGYDLEDLVSLAARVTLAELISTIASEQLRFIAQAA